MDEAGRIIGELQQKLQQLDHRVCLYRRDMTSEYSKYAENLLRDVPEDVSKAVSVAMLESLKSYPSLFPEYEITPSKSAENRSSAPTTSGTEGDMKKPDEATVPVSSVAPGTHAERPRSPHEREIEFQGLFTPSYLPLLDSSNQNERRSSKDSPPKTIDPLPQAPPVNTTSASSSAPSDTTQALKDSPEIIPKKPPMPIRKNTDEVSMSSDQSDSPRRSALRKGSSGSIKGHSPRRVRFDVEGEEVLPTTSPEVPSYLSEAEQRTPIILGYTGDDSSDDEACSQQVEDVAAAAPPPPKRISSSQALRTLSRGPVEDDGTKWTEVVAPPDGSPSIPTSEAEKEFSFHKVDGPANAEAKTEDVAPKPSTDLITDMPAKTSSPVPTPSLTGQVQRNARPSSSESPISPQESPITSPTSIPGASSVSILSPPVLNGSLSKSIPNLVPTRQRFSLDIDTPTTPVPIPASSQKETLKFNPDEDDVLFDFDDDPEEPEGLEVIEEQDELASPGEITAQQQRSINSRSEKENDVAEMASSPARTIPRIETGSYIDPSYKGTKREGVNYAFKQPIVGKDMHSQAEKMGPVSSFIGSVDGRSGVDASDVKSYRGSGVGSLRGGGGAHGGSYMGSLRGGVPGSFSERLMMEEMEGEKRRS